MIEVHPIKAFSDNYIWLIKNTASGHCLLVDPGQPEPVLQYLSTHNLTLEAILITHKHADHVGGVKQILKAHPVPVYGPHTEVKAWADHDVKQGQTLQFPLTDISFEVLSIPGHTLGHVAFYADKRLFCGDTLFVAGCGRVFEGTMAQMYQSLQLLTTLPEETQIYCAHEYTLSNLAFANTVDSGNQALIDFTQKAQEMREQDIPTVPSSIGLEKRINPFLRCHEPKVIQAARQRDMIIGSDPVDVFASIRRWKDEF